MVVGAHNHQLLLQVVDFILLAYAAEHKNGTADDDDGRIRK